MTWHSQLAFAIEAKQMNRRIVFVVTFILVVLAFVSVHGVCDQCQTENPVACHNETVYSLCINGTATLNYRSCPEDYVCTADVFVCYPRNSSVPSCVRTEIADPEQSQCAVCGSKGKVFACLNETTVAFCFGADKPHYESLYNCPKGTVCDLNSGSKFCSNETEAMPSCKKSTTTTTPQAITTTLETIIITQTTTTTVPTTTTESTTPDATTQEPTETTTEMTTATTATTTTITTPPTTTPTTTTTATATPTTTTPTTTLATTTTTPAPTTTTPTTSKPTTTTHTTISTTTTTTPTTTSITTPAATTTTPTTTTPTTTMTTTTLSTVTTTPAPTTTTPTTPTTPATNTSTTTSTTTTPTTSTPTTISTTTTPTTTSTTTTPAPTTTTPTTTTTEHTLTPAEICENNDQETSIANPNDLTCTEYIICMRSGSSWIATEATCPSNQYFNPTFAFCTTTYECPTQQTNTTTITTTVSTTTTQETSTTTLSPAQVCEANGVQTSIAQPNDTTCKAYIVCSKPGSVWIASNKTCPTNKWFDPTEGKCSKTYTCPTSS